MSKRTPSYSELLKEIEQGNVQSLLYSPTTYEVEVLFDDGTRFNIPVLPNFTLGWSSVI